MPSLNNRLAPWTRRFVDLLQYGPYPFEEAVYLASLFVPPGRAMRRFAASGANKEIFSTEDQIKSGSRSIVLESVRMLAYRERILIYTDGVVEYAFVSDYAYESYFGHPRPYPIDMSGLTMKNRYATLRSKSTIAPAGGAIDDPDNRPADASAADSDRTRAGDRVAWHDFDSASEQSAYAHVVYDAV